MSYEVTQLSQEEIVGEEVVLKDINPITNTNAVNDNTNGMTLDQTIQRLWNSINNKLSRVVNSVNGRTGVVLLNSNDVGLGNVDNVSFADIKKWVIEQIEQAFENKRLRLFDSFEQLDQLLATNDQIYKDTPYFIDELNQYDRRSYIGYIYYDDNEKRLTYSHMPINVIGYTNDSIIYNEKVGKTDLSGGGIGVNISCYEDALQIYNGKTKDESGLKIDKTKISNAFYSFDCVYGPRNPLIATDTSSKNNKIVFVFVTEDNALGESNMVTLTPKFRVADGVSFKINDLILCNFREYFTMSTIGEVPDGMDYRLMHRMPHIGRVVNAPSDDNPDQDYVVHFHAIEPQLGWGLKYAMTHYNSITNSGDPNNMLDKHITLKLSSGHKRGFHDVYNISGLQVLSGKNSFNPNNTDDMINKPASSLTYRSLPEGSAQCGNHALSDFGLQIDTDMSLCVMPYSVYGYGSDEDITDGSAMIDNWYALSPAQSKDYQKLISGTTNDGTLYDTCLLGINLNKFVYPSDDTEHRPNAYKFANISGLRVIPPGEFLDGSMLGVQADPDVLVKILGNDMSGGLAVNVGRCLEISPGDDAPTGMKSYYNSGKVNVRIGKGIVQSVDNSLEVNVDQTSIKLTDYPYNFLSINFGETESLYDPTLTNHERQGTGLAIDTVNGLQVANGYGIGFDNNGQIKVKKRVLNISDSSGNSQQIQTVTETADNGGDGLLETVDIVFGDGLIVTFD